MRTGLTKRQKTTGIFFDEQSSIIEVQRVGEEAGNTDRTVTLEDSGVNAAILCFIIIYIVHIDFPCSFS